MSKEAYRPIAGYEGYEVSDYGNIRKFCAEAKGERWVDLNTCAP